MRHVSAASGAKRRLTTRLSRGAPYLLTKPLIQNSFHKDVPETFHFAVNLPAFVVRRTMAQIVPSSGPRYAVPNGRIPTSRCTATTPDVDPTPNVESRYRLNIRNIRGPGHALRHRTRQPL